MTRTEELRQIIEEARAELNALEAVVRKERVQPLIGKCFRFRNSYGAGEPSWWIYARVLHANDGFPVINQFQTGCRGEIRVERGRTFPVNFIHEWDPIAADELAWAWQALVRDLATVGLTLTGG